VRILGIFFCLTALVLAGYSAVAHKAPEIEAEIESRTVEVLVDLDAADLEVRVDGRHVTLQGRVDDDQQRQEILLAAADVPGAVGPTDRLEHVGTVTPYRFDAVKEESGEVVISGFAPDEAVRDMIETEARALLGDEASIKLELAAGAPSDDWAVAATTALDALATTRQGRLTIIDREIALEGDVPADESIDAIGMFAQSMPEGYHWTDSVVVRLETVRPFTFNVVKDADGVLHLDGYAPDEATRVIFIEEGKAAGGDKPIVAAIRLADGMPDPEWPSLVQAGIGAMKDMEAGRFDVVDNDVSFSSDPAAAPGDGPLVETLTEGEGAREVAVSDPSEPSRSADGEPTVDAALVPATTEAPDANVLEAPAPVITVDKAEEGAWSVRGAVPDQDAKTDLVAVIENLAGSDRVDVELELTGGGANADWQRFVKDHIRTLDTVRAGRLLLEGGRAHLIGVVSTPEEIAPVRAALAAIDEAMTIDLQPIDPRPLASLDLEMSAESGLILNGNLPGQMTEGEALLALGLRRYDGKLGINGRGPADGWRDDLSAIGRFLPIFETLELSLGGERPRIKGQISAHRDADDVARQIVLALGREGQAQANIEIATTVQEDGARRTSPLNGAEETYRQGYWLPVIQIVADEKACRERSSDMLADDKITFLRGEDGLDARAETILNRLASLAITCLDETGLLLEIGGHTDSRGSTSLNRELSQSRADAVLNALLARGVDVNSLIAVGYGDKRPVADNATDEGRATNRRITFEWKASSDARSAETRG